MMAAYDRFGRRQTRSLRAAVESAYYEQGRRAVAPLMGYPGLGLSRTTVKQNQFNHAVQYQTVSRLYEAFRPDAMLFLMDLSVEASALGLPVRFPLDETPTVEGHPVQCVADLDAYRGVDILADGRLMVYLEVMRHMRAGLPVPVGAYVTGPYTLAGLMMGASEMAMNVMLEPDLCKAALEFATATVRRYAQALIDDGADFLVVLDPTAVMLGPNYYNEFAGMWVRELVGLCNAVEVVLHICGDTRHIVRDMAATGASGLSLDHPMDMRQVAGMLGDDTLLVGNVDPVRLLHESRETVAADARALVESMADVPGFLMSSGCDLPQDVPLENIRAMMETARAWRAPVSEQAAAAG